MNQLESNADEAPIAQDLYTHDLYGLVHASGESNTVDAPAIPDGELTEITALMNSLARLREAERELSEASREFMQLTDQEMRALRYLVVGTRQGDLVTPSVLAHHLKISAASSTKLLNRLERGQYIVRSLHPHDRRAIKIDVTPECEALMQRTVGRQQARRFYAAANLTGAERKVVMRFLDGMTRDIRHDEANWANPDRSATPPAAQ